MTVFDSVGGEVSLYNLDGARGPDQRRYMSELQARGECLFCESALLSDPHQVVLHDGRHWTVIQNRYPYAGAERHLLLIPKMHVMAMVALSPEILNSFWPLVGAIVDKHRFTSYAVGVRNGDPRRTAGTITHVHAHLIEPNGTAPLRMRFG